jgi:hypothetical protein
VELCFEGHQFYDIIRTKRAEQILKNDAMQYETFVIPGQLKTLEGLPKKQYGENFDLGKDDMALSTFRGGVCRNTGITMHDCQSGSDCHLPQ